MWASQPEAQYCLTSTHHLQLVNCVFPIPLFYCVLVLYPRLLVIQVRLRAAPTFRAFTTGIYGSLVILWWWVGVQNSLLKWVLLGGKAVFLVYWVHGRIGWGHKEHGRNLICNFSFCLWTFLGMIDLGHTCCFLSIDCLELEIPDYNILPTVGGQRWWAPR